MVTEVEGLALVEEVARRCRVPLAWGGGIRSLADAERLFAAGVDKIVLTTAAATQPELVSVTANRWGSQAVCVGIDYRLVDGLPVTYVDSGQTPVRGSLAERIRHAEDLGAGELLLHAIDRDGAATGMDVSTIAEVLEISSLPVVALGGAGSPGDLADAAQLNPGAVAASNLWHFSELVAEAVRREFSRRSLEVRIL